MGNIRNGNVDIAEIIIKDMPNETETQQRIKLYIQTHKNNCNEFLYNKYERETVFLNTIIKTLRADLGADIVRVLENNQIVLK